MADLKAIPHLLELWPYIVGGDQDGTNRLAFAISGTHFDQREVHRLCRLLASMCPGHVIFTTGYNIRNGEDELARILEIVPS